MARLARHAVSEGEIEAMSLLLDAGEDLQIWITVLRYPAPRVALDKGHIESPETNPTLKG